GGAELERPGSTEPLDVRTVWRADAPARETAVDCREPRAPGRGQAWSQERTFLGLDALGPSHVRPPSTRTRCEGYARRGHQVFSIYGIEAPYCSRHTWGGSASLGAQTPVTVARRVWASPRTEGRAGARF